MKGDDFNIIAVGPIGMNLHSRELELIENAAGRGRTGRKLLGDVVIAMLRQPRAEAPLIVDEKLRERPLAARHVGHVSMPASPVVDLPALDSPAPADHRPLVAKCFIHHGGEIGPGIIRREAERFGEIIASAANRHDDRRLTIGLIVLQATDQLPSPCDRGQRAIGVRGVRLRGAAGPGVFSV